ncbi:hypothetical protein HL658_30345 [Azospirillum sp. RWY-5-1]|uniref:DNA binding HTH domain-containing protein n=1 Tax=Azospirillum oleiclasticum TaxID=2735135 RepID=A0ABX2TL04_9PROT|nr:helix-turn-helix domain-containing protein [Azospirillum oleiclasticum]NYZ16867.1 hypothetical protein [Azospirillum oleiclasticum]NYZ24400.1 hypothetical protein [Azospirillum oleiclasticum]
MVPRTLLIVDDGQEPGLPAGPSFAGCAIVTTGPDEAVGALRRHQPPVVVLPLPPTDDRGAAALDTLNALLEEAPSIKVIVPARAAQRRLAIRAVARGAFDLCTLPIDSGELERAVERAFHRADLEQEVRQLATGDTPPTLRVVRDEAERRALVDAMARSRGNLSAAARLLAVSRPTLYSLLRQHGMKVE